MVIIFIIITQLIYLILITYFRREHHIEVAQGTISRIKMLTFYKQIT